MNKSIFKALSSLCAIIIIINSIIVQTYAAESPNSTTNTKETIKIKNVIQKYFNDEFDSKKNRQAVNENSIICNEKLKTYNNLKYTKEAMWYKGLNDTLNNYSIKINYYSILFNNDTCTVDLTKDTTFSLTKAPNIISKEYGINHIMTLKKINNNWFIDSDIDKSDPAENIENKDLKNSLYFSSNINSLNNNTILDKKIELLQNDLKDINLQINTFNKLKDQIKKNSKNLTVDTTNSINNSTIKRSSSTLWNTYNWQAAINYAHKWANSFNPQYPKFDSDCANFVSQCIYAGAPVMNFDKRWYCNSIIIGKAWSCVPEQWSFLVNNRESGPVAIDNTRNLEICNGDLIQLWSTYYNCYHHSVIVTANDGQGGLYYSAHTLPRYDYSLDDAYASGSYDSSKERTAHILGYCH
jgi:hypothetical protein